MIEVNPQDILSKAVKYIHEYNISQIPVIAGNVVVGSLNEASLMKLLHDGVDFAKQEVSAVMGKPLPTVDEDVDVSEAYRLLLSGTIGLVVTRNKVPAGIITRADLINYWVNGKGGL